MMRGHPRLGRSLWQVRFQGFIPQGIDGARKVSGISAAVDHVRVSIQTRRDVARDMPRTTRLHVG
jgi:hypothetical protein